MIWTAPDWAVGLAMGALKWDLTPKHPLRMIRMGLMRHAGVGLADANAMPIRKLVGLYQDLAESMARERPKG